MSLRAIYPWTTTMMVIGVFAFGYGVQTGSILMIAEGIFLVWLATKATIEFIAVDT